MTDAERQLLAKPIELFRDGVSFDRDLHGALVSEALALLRPPGEDVPSKLLATIGGVNIWQDPDLRVHYVADMDVDVDGAGRSYRIDNNPLLALDDIHASAGWPGGSWQNVLARDPHDHSKPYADLNGYCVSKTSYQWPGLPEIDRARYVDAAAVPYSVPPGRVRALCRGVLLGCSARITDTLTGKSIQCVTADFSGNRIGEASLAAARFFNPALSARNGDDRKIYRYEFFAGTPANIQGREYPLIPA